MQLIEFDFHWISGCMLGIELLHRGDVPDPSVQSGIVIDIFILRVMILFRDTRSV